MQLAKTEIESLSAERARLKAAVERLDSDKIAAENKAEVMKSVAYCTFIIALAAIVSSFFFGIRKRSTGPKWIGPEPIPVQAIGHSSVADDPLPFKWSDLKSVFDIKKDRNGKEAKSEEIVAKLRQVDVLASQGQTTVERGDVLSVAAGVRWAEHRASQAPEGP